MAIVVSSKLLRFAKVRQEIIMPMKLSEGEPSSNIKTTFATLSELI